MLFRSDGLRGIGGNDIGYKQWLGGQWQFTTTDKYHKKKTIQWGKPCIYISNDNPYMDPKIDSDWLAKNTIIIELKEGQVNVAKRDQPQ